MRRRDVLAGALAVAGCASVSGEAHARPLVIAHRGASGERPEHTMAAYRLAIAQGADFIEPDLVMTRDGVLVCRHENEISGTTDVSTRAQFADRRRTKTVDGVTAEGWWVEDFTLAELKTLRCRERLQQLRPANTAYNDTEEIPAFAEVLALALEANVGVYPELKHPTFLREQGLDPVPAFIAAVHAMGGQRAADAMFVQCFETWPLRTLAAMSSLRWRCIQLMASDAGPWDRPHLSAEAMRGDEGLRATAEYAAGVGVEKALIWTAPEQGPPQRTDFVERAHAAGLAVHAWTFRAENYFLAGAYRRGDATAEDYLRQHGDLDAELRAFYAAGVDGVFSDFPAMAVAARA